MIGVFADVVRLNLDKLDNLKKAKAVLRTKVLNQMVIWNHFGSIIILCFCISLLLQCDTSTVCLMVANVCEKQGNYVKFLFFLDLIG